MSVLRPDLMMRSVVPVIMAGIIAVRLFSNSFLYLLCSRLYSIKGVLLMCPIFRFTVLLCRFSSLVTVRSPLLTVLGDKSPKLPLCPQ